MEMLQNAVQAGLIGLVVVAIICLCYGIGAN